MRITLTTLTILMLAATVASTQEAAPRPAIVLHAESSVTGTEVLLSQVAEIAAEPELAQRLAAVSLGSAPVASTCRTITAGYIKLRLRRFGLDPDQLEITGASVKVHGPTAATQTPSSAAPKAPEAPLELPLIRRGQMVEVEVHCGGVTIHTTGRAGSDAAAGELLSITLQKTGRNVTARAIAAGTAILIAPGSAS